MFMNVHGESRSDWEALVSAQAGIATHVQARQAGFSDRQITYRLSSGKWQRVHRGVYATCTGPLPRAARLWAALLWAGEGAVLSHEPQKASGFGSETGIGGLERYSTLKFIRLSGG